MRLPRTARLSAALTAAALTAVLTVPGGAAVASPRSETKAKKAKVDADAAAVSEDLAGTSAELAGAYDRLAQARGQLPAAQAELDAAKAVEAEAERKDAEMAGRLAAAEQAQKQAQADVDASADELADTRVEMGRLAAASYRHGGSTDQWSVVMQAESPDDFADRFVLADTVARRQAGTLSNVAERQAVQTNAKTRLDAVKGEVKELREQARAALQAAEAARKEAAAKKAAVDKLVADAASAAAVIESRKAEEEARLGQLKSEQDRLESQLRAIADQERAAARTSGGGAVVDPGPASGGGVFLKPVNARLTSNFGYRIHPIYRYKRLHAGSDFGASCGTPIRAAGDGRIVSAGWAGGYGNRIVISHGIMGGQSTSTVYAHMSRYAVRGGNVSRGQIIGYVGTTGASTGCHLHFEVRKNGAATNPMKYL